ncbi:hypothetical protein DIPPA_20136 [Diplonema papillatum]|nr:hypothetical protein DIPPA_20136 [Diplonema papillatum]
MEPVEIPPNVDSGFRFETALGAVLIGIGAVFITLLLLGKMNTFAPPIDGDIKAITERTRFPLDDDGDDCEDVTLALPSAR